MTCRELADFLDDYLAGELTAERRMVFDGHLLLCVDCRNYLDSYRRTIELGKQAFEDDAAPVPAEIPSGLVNAILKARRMGKA